MYVGRKSDEVIVVQKQTNNSELHEIVGFDAEYVERSASAKGNLFQTARTTTQCVDTLSPGLERIRQAAKRDSKTRFSSLLHHMTPDVLSGAYRSLNPKSVPGVDEMTWQAYGKGLDERLRSLHQRIQSGHYHAMPSKRIWITKADGRKRPIGIAALEDKIVQKGLVWVLESIYETDFLGFSYGFRPGRSQHRALDALHVAITQRKVSWVLDADIQGFFDTLSHDWLLRFLEHRVSDPRILRLVKKFLRTGVSEDGQWSKTEVGTPQGSVASPFLANVYLHYVLDLWVHWWRRHHARGEVYIVRYADDFVVCFQYGSDGRHFVKALRTRLTKFELTLHPGKTRLIEFGRFATANRRERSQGKPETFDFLGFTHICDTRRSDGTFTVRRKTIAKRLRAKIQAIRIELLKNRSLPVWTQGAWLRSVIQGYINYHGIPGNRGALNTLRTELCKAWLFALRRRSQKSASLSWGRFKKLVSTWIPSVRIVHPYPNQRFSVGPKAGAGRVSSARPDLYRRLGK